MTPAINVDPGGAASLDWTDSDGHRHAKVMPEGVITQADWFQAPLADLVHERTPVVFLVGSERRKPNHAR